MLKQPDAERRPAAGSGIKWDEENLQDNERIKASLSSVRINEPKTPYHGPLDESDPAHQAMMMDADGNDGGLQPLHLDAEHSAGSLPSANGHGFPSSADSSALTSSAQSAPDNGFSDDGGSHSSRRRSTSSGARVHINVDAPPGEAAMSPGGAHGESGDEAANAVEARKSTFVEMRKSHYNMKAAMQQARRLSDVGADEDENGDADVTGQELGRAADGNADDTV